jgi:hypothetical protein
MAQREVLIITILTKVYGNKWFALLQVKKQPRGIGEHEHEHVYCMGRMLIIT